MDRTMNESISIPFYHYVCSKFGTTDEVNTRRTVLNTLDFVSETDLVANISSGSRGEGLDMKNSDIDFMILFKHVNVFEDASKADILNSFVLETDDTKPGYAMLKSCSRFISNVIMSFCVPKRTFCTSGSTFSVKADIFLSSERIKSVFHSMSSNSQSFQVKVHGPCISDHADVVDKAICFRCRSWIKQAQKWLRRNRMWPSHNLITSIANYGALVVPIGCKNSKNEDLEWRISFSVAEKQLIHAFTHTQLLCYALLKVVLKEIINKYRNCEGLLCSYFIKTTIFWVSEEMAESEWIPINFVACFERVLRRLTYFVEYEILPHYFLDDCNLFENRFTTAQKISLNEVLYKASRDGVYCLIQSETISRFFQRDFKVWKRAMSSDLDQICNQVNAMFSNIFLIGGFPSVPQRLKKFLKSFKSHTFVNTSVFYGICLKEGLLNTSTSGCRNREHFKRHKFSLPLLVLGSRSDAVSGWLYIASYFYCRKQYRTVLIILRHILSKFTANKLFKYGVRLKASNVNIIEVEALKRSLMTTYDLYRRYAISLCHLSPLYDLIPAETETEVRMNRNVMVNPLIFAHFLSFLCTFHLHDYRRCQQALHDLQFAIDWLRCGSINSFVFCNSLHCLGTAQMMAGRRHAAFRSFKESFDLIGTRYAELMKRCLSNIN